MTLRTRAFFFAFCLVATMRCASAQTAATPMPQSSASPQTDQPERFSVHAQMTNTQQYHGSFPGAYSGAQSLSPTPDTAKTFSASGFLGSRLWRGAEGYANAEIDQGFGFNGTFGVAGFPNGGAYKVGSASPYERVQRYFIRQTFNYGGGSQAVEPDINQLGGAEDAKHLTLTFGKYSVVDIFDTNTYAHDPSNDFLNWAIIDAGAFDYAADAWGFTDGLTAELSGKQSALRGGLFQLSATPNTTVIEHTPFRQYSAIVEYERQTAFFGGRPGKIKVLEYGDDGYMAVLADAAAAAAGTGVSPDVAPFRANKHWKLGSEINVEQEIAPHVGFFSRLSAQNGTYESFDFTEIDRSASGGLSVDGGLWKRPDDAIGVAGVVNGLSQPHRQYFEAGGMGILIGDGALSYGDERIVETYYRLGIKKKYTMTGDYQRIVNPAYNTARGPVSVYSLRFRAQI